jgi:maltooligosyltrehalose trehalohydrolase
MLRKLPIGAEPQAGGGVHFRVWAPASRTAAVEFQAPDGTVQRIAALEPEPDGYFSGTIAEARVGLRYKIRLDRGAFPDPASRFQPDGPHGPSQIVDPAAFTWTDHAFVDAAIAAGRERAWRHLAIYELHLGTFTPEGTWRAAAARLPELVDLGITMIEVMPVADFPGDFGWGYDGVDIFAPCRLYGGPDDARMFVNRAHELGLRVVLDVVYNHVGPDGNFLREFSPDYFSKKYKNEWGDPLNFDDANSGPVREFFISNARYWIDEYHFDGLRLDATQQIYDASPRYLVAEVAAAAREAGRGRPIWIVAEDETQRGRLVRSPDVGGYGLDAIWNDDFHHSAHVAATGRAEAYYRDYRGKAQEFVAAAKHGFLFQGEWYAWQRQRRGTPALDLPPHRFVIFLENHDQVSNSLRGLRLHQETSPAKFRALTALLLLSPQVPMLFQGQEFAASAPFTYFADHRGDLGRAVAQGRRQFIEQFSTAGSPEAREFFPDPTQRATFERCRLDWSERERNRATLQLHRDLLRLRRDDPTLTDPARVDGAVLERDAFVLRYFSREPGADRLLVVNLGTDLDCWPAPEPLLAPIEGQGWRIRWSSESPAYGGNGTPPYETTCGWVVHGHTVALLEPCERTPLPDARVAERDEPVRQ